MRRRLENPHSELPRLLSYPKTDGKGRVVAIGKIPSAIFVNLLFNVIFNVLIYQKGYVKVTMKCRFIF
jgi:hypothetical protein